MIQVKPDIWVGESFKCYGKESFASLYAWQQLAFVQSLLLKIVQRPHFHFASAAAQGDGIKNSKSRSEVLQVASAKKFKGVSRSQDDTKLQQIFDVLSFKPMA
jgi:hypothetical protein